MRTYIFLLLSLVNTLICSSQVLTINVSENNFGIDESNSLIVSHIKNIHNYTHTNEYSEIIITLGQKNYYFTLIPDSLTYSSSYLVTDSITSTQYALYFTQLPIILIESTNTIVNEPKVLASLTYSDKEQILVSNIGIELRGGSSLSYPKKTYDIEFWGDEVGNETNNVQFGNLRSDDDWILDALYNEPLRLRSYVANKLWLQMHTPNYINDEPNAKSGANVMYVEMFLNGQYNGLYNLSEQIDKKQLKLKSYTDHHIRGELYKGVSWGASTFSSLPNYDNESRKWSGYEYRYPKEDDITDWENLYQFTDFVLNSSKLGFKNDIWAKFDSENFIDYFLFLNLIRATDNTGKNIYLAKYKVNEPYFYVPWDVDGCFGTIWNGTNENVTDDILSNGFINRAIDLDPNNIAKKMSNKWFNYRSNIFSNESLSNSFSERYSFFQATKIYERESLAYANYLFNNSDLSYTLTWLENRLEFLDAYFEKFISTNDESSSDKNKLIISPNPVVDMIYFKSLTGENFKIYNNLGQLVMDGVINDGKISIEILKKGLYFIVINDSSHKFIKI